MTTGCVVRSSLAVAVVTALMAGSSGPWSPGRGPLNPAEAESTAELWVEPGDIGQRDAFHGPGGRDGAPPQDGVFEVKGIDTTGFSRGYTVADGEGRVWDVKVGPEAQPEVVVSRVLWLIGYHQPVSYLVTNWRRAGDARQQLSARFRLQSDHDIESDWSWTVNPFAGTREMKGLVIVNLLLNNWDFKTSNNRIYKIAPAASGPARRFVVQDLGASLGGTGWPTGTRNDVGGFERQRFVSWENGQLQFDYRGRHRELLEDLTAADVTWACRLIERITDRQWADIFGAAAYPEAVAARYRAHLEAKLAEGLALAQTSQVKP